MLFEAYQRARGYRLSGPTASWLLREIREQGYDRGYTAVADSRPIDCAFRYAGAGEFRCFRRGCLWSACASCSTIRARHPVKIRHLVKMKRTLVRDFGMKRTEGGRDASRAANLCLGGGVQ